MNNIILKYRIEYCPINIFIPPDERENGVTHGGFLPLNRIKTIVSMTTPRDFHFQNNTILPPFIEMDMAPEGFGCIYIPSMAPTSSHSVSVVGVSSLGIQFR